MKVPQEIWSSASHKATVAELLRYQGNLDRHEPCTLSTKGGSGASTLYCAVAPRFKAKLRSYILTREGFKAKGAKCRTGLSLAQTPDSEGGSARLLLYEVLETHHEIQEAISY